MSYVTLEENLKKQAGFHSSGGRGGNIVSLAAQELLSAHRLRTIQDKDGNEQQVKELDVYARTRYPSPGNSAGMVFYSKAYKYHFGISPISIQKDKAAFEELHDDYSVFMISKDGKGREEFSLVAGSAALAAQRSEDSPLDALNKQ